MKIAPAPVQKPAPPTVSPGVHELDVPFTGPVTENKVLGYIPSDTFSHLLVDTGDCDKPVVRAEPVLGPDGAPRFSTQLAHLDLTPYSPIKRGLLGGAIGAGILGAAGAVVGYFTGNLALGAIIGTGVGAAAGAGIGAEKVMGDKVTPDWELRPVVRHELDGYSHTFIPQTTTITTGKTTTTITTGYWHSYSPNIKDINVGNMQYWAPVAQHSSDL